MAAQTGGYGLPTGGFAAGGGKTGAPAATGWGGWSDYATTPVGGVPAAPADPDALAEGMGGKSDKGYVPGGYTPNFDRTFAEELFSDWHTVVWLGWRARARQRVDESTWADHGRRSSP
jgi:hypothetical protein